MTIAKIDVSVDIIVRTRDGIALVLRGSEPYKDHWAIPGGGVELGETLKEAAVRETREETGVDVPLDSLHLLGVYSRPDRDPRGHCITMAYVAKSYDGDFRAGSDAKEIGVFKMSELPKKLAFDHLEILRDYGTWSYHH